MNDDESVRLECLRIAQQQAPKATIKGLKNAAEDLAKWVGQKPKSPVGY